MLSVLRHEQCEVGKPHQNHRVRLTLLRCSFRLPPLTYILHFFLPTHHILFLKVTQRETTFEIKVRLTHPSWDSNEI